MANELDIRAEALQKQLRIINIARNLLREVRGLKNATISVKLAELRTELGYAKDADMSKLTGDSFETTLPDVSEEERGEIASIVAGAVGLAADIASHYGEIREPQEPK